MIAKRKELRAKGEERRGRALTAYRFALSLRVWVR